jgi:surface polysaccharide O-acyltransferase-like enzyme
MCVHITNPEVDNKKNEGTLSLPINLIRTVGIALVVMLHVSNEYYTAIYSTQLEPTVDWWTATIYKFLTLSCLPLFVMLSGALLLQPSKLNEPIKILLKKRANRIGWAYAFWSAVYLVWGFFVSQIPVTSLNVIQGITKGLFTGPWYHFWFLYLIAGLYLVTPILRAVVAYRHRNLLRYLIILWFLPVAVVPLIQLLTGYVLNTTLFVLGGWVGYFVLGTYLQKVRMRSSILYGLFFLGLIWTVASTWFMNFVFESSGQNYFFFDYLTPNVIVASVALFMILSKFNADWPGINHPRASRFIHAISSATLPIFLFHVIILESLQRGYFGFKLSLTIINPIYGIPVITIVTFFITFGLVLIMGKVPVLKKLIGYIAL